jgi:cyclopropane fatty-acyl-phospholipid synthase-like methyltransferase
MQENWWENFFHGVALDFWRAAMSEEQTRAEADFIQKQLQLSARSRVLDVPCGNGRLSIELARRGFQLTGVDFAGEFIDEAKLKSSAGGVVVDFHERDMRDLTWIGEFDGAFCFGNSFGYLNDDENADFLQTLSQTLKPGARFILDAPAIAECLLPNLQPQRSITVAGISVSIENRYDENESRIFTDFTFMRNGETDKRQSSQRIYTYQELSELLSLAELQTEVEFSSLAEQPFELGSRRLLLICKKRKGATK